MALIKASDIGPGEFFGSEARFSGTELRIQRRPTQRRGSDVPEEDNDHSVGVLFEEIRDRLIQELR